MSANAYFSSIEDIIADAKAGKMFILVDDENRENEGDLIIPATFATAEAINFMAKFGRGLICLALDSATVERLGLPPMARSNHSRHQTAFTISIEAREGISTGISAADRAHTIATAIYPESEQADIVSPGHVFPLEAREGGVLVRAGHTEAAVDMARLAGLSPAGVICEIMNDDGSMARLDDLIPFAATHGLKIASIADLIAYRRRSEKLVECFIETRFTSHFSGDFTLRIYASTIGYAEHIVLIKGELSKDKPTLVRMHSFDWLQDVLHDANSAKPGALQAAMKQINERGSGIIVIIREANKGAVSDVLRRREEDGFDSNTPLRDYGIGAQILLDLGVRDLILISNAKHSVIGLEGYGIHIHGYEPLVIES